MKKLIAIFLALTLCLGLFAGCNKTEEKSGLDSALEYLKGMYRDSDEKTPMGYSVTSIVRIGDVTYDVSWAIEIVSGVDTAVSVGEDDGMTTTIVVDEENGTETSYNLIGTISDSDGKTVTATFAHLVPKVPTTEEILTAAYALESGGSMDSTSKLTGTVTKINTAYDAGYKNITVTIVCSGYPDYPIMCYRLKGDGCENIAVGDLITVTGTLTNYSGTIEYTSGCELLELVAGGGDSSLIEDAPQVDYTTMTEAELLEAAYALEAGDSFTDAVTLTGAITSIDTEWSEDYQNITVTIQVGDYSQYPIQCFRLKGDGASTLAVGDTITVTGTITNYSGTVEFTSGCTLDSVTGGNASSEPKPTTTNTGSEGSTSDAYVLATSVKDGDKVILVNTAYNKAISATTNSSGYLLGTDVAPSDSKITTAGSDIVWTLKAVDGGYQISNANGETISCTSGFGYGTSDNVWEFVFDGSSLLIKSTTAKGSSGDSKYIEWYASYSDFSTYYLANADASLFAMNVYVLN